MPEKIVGHWPHQMLNLLNNELANGQWVQTPPQFNYVLLYLNLFVNCLICLSWYHHRCSPEQSNRSVFGPNITCIITPWLIFQFFFVKCYTSSVNVTPRMQRIGTVVKLNGNFFYFIVVAFKFQRLCKYDGLDLYNMVTKSAMNFVA